MEPGTDYSKQKLLSIIYQTPVGVIEMDQQGEILHMNAKGIQLLMPFFMQAGLAGNNLLTLLDRHVPQIRTTLGAPSPAFKAIFNQHPFVLPLRLGNGDVERHFWITINKQDDGSFTAFFDDVTHRYEREQVLQQAILDRAVQQGQFDIASGVLHDIGNAVVAFGSYLTRIRRQLKATDINHLSNLVLFFEKNRAALVPALGEGKAQAIVKLLEGILDNQKNKDEETQKALNEQVRIVTHIQEVIAIQRQYIRNGDSRERPKVNIRTILNDCVDMQSAWFEKRDIRVTLQTQTEHMRLSGDRTKLMQVFLNLLKNSQEALESQAGTDKWIRIELTGDDRNLTVCIADNGVGFDPSLAESLFEKGISSKEEGSGLGLNNCRSIVETHAGQLKLTSPGPGQGATTLITFSL